MENEIHNLKSIFIDLNEYLPYNYPNKTDYLQITEYTNGEGYVVDLNGKTINLSWDDIDIINYAILKLRYAKKN